MADINKQIDISINGNLATELEKISKESEKARVIIERFTNELSEGNAKGSESVQKLVSELKKNNVEIQNLMSLKTKDAQQDLQNGRTNVKTLADLESQRTKLIKAIESEISAKGQSQVASANEYNTAKETIGKMSNMYDKISSGATKLKADTDMLTSAQQRANAIGSLSVAQNAQIDRQIAENNVLTSEANRLNEADVVITEKQVAKKVSLATQLRLMKQELTEMALAGKQGTQSFNDLQSRIITLNEGMKDTRENISNLGNGMRVFKLGGAILQAGLATATLVDSIGKLGAELGGEDNAIAQGAAAISKWLPLLIAVQAGISAIQTVYSVMIKKIVAETNDLQQSQQKLANQELVLKVNNDEMESTRIEIDELTEKLAIVGEQIKTAFKSGDVAKEISEDMQNVKDFVDGMHENQPDYRPSYESLLNQGYTTPSSALGLSGEDKAMYDEYQRQLEDIIESTDTWEEKQKDVNDWIKLSDENIELLGSKSKNIKGDLEAQREVYREQTKEQEKQIALHNKMVKSIEAQKALTARINQAEAEGNDLLAWRLKKQKELQGGTVGKVVKKGIDLFNEGPNLKTPTAVSTMTTLLDLTKKTSSAMGNIALGGIMKGASMLTSLINPFTVWAGVIALVSKGVMHLYDNFSGVRAIVDSVIEKGKKLLEYLTGGAEILMASFGFLKDGVSEKFVNELKAANDAFIEMEKHVEDIKDHHKEIERSLAVGLELLNLRKLEYASEAEWAKAVQKETDKAHRVKIANIKKEILANAVLQNSYDWEKAQLEGVIKSEGKSGLAEHETGNLAELERTKKKRALTDDENIMYESLIDKRGYTEEDVKQAKIALEELAKNEGKYTEIHKALKDQLKEAGDDYLIYKANEGKKILEAQEAELDASRQWKNEYLKTMETEEVSLTKDYEAEMKKLDRAMKLNVISHEEYLKIKKDLSEKYTKQMTEIQMRPFVESEKLRQKYMEEETEAIKRQAREEIEEMERVQKAKEDAIKKRINDPNADNASKIAAMDVLIGHEKDTVRLRVAIAKEANKKLELIYLEELKRAEAYKKEQEALLRDLFDKIRDSEITFAPTKEKQAERETDKVQAQRFMDLNKALDDTKIAETRDINGVRERLKAEGKSIDDGQAEILAIEERWRQKRDDLWTGYHRQNQEDIDKALAEELKVYNEWAEAMKNIIGQAGQDLLIGYSELFKMNNNEELVAIYNKYQEELIMLGDKLDQELIMNQEARDQDILGLTESLHNRQITINEFERGVRKAKLKQDEADRKAKEAHDKAIMDSTIAKDKAMKESDEQLRKEKIKKEREMYLKIGESAIDATVATVMGQLTAQGFFDWGVSWAKALALGASAGALKVALRSALGFEDGGSTNIVNRSAVASGGYLPPVKDLIITNDSKSGKWREYVVRGDIAEKHGKELDIINFGTDKQREALFSGKNVQGGVRTVRSSVLASGGYAKGSTSHTIYEPITRQLAYSFARLEKSIIDSSVNSLLQSVGSRDVFLMAKRGESNINQIK